MFKRFTARLLILLQIYNCVFQGVAHANVIQAHHAVRDEIYLHTSPGKDGSLRIALGTNRGDDGGGEELLDVIEVPSYDALAKTSRSLQLSQHVPPFQKPLPTDAGVTDSLQPDLALGLSPSTAVPKTERDATPDLDLDTDHELDTQSLFSKSGVTRAVEGAHFTLQGLEVFVSNTGEALIQGKQTDFSKPIFLSNPRGIVLKDVDASTIKLIAPSILGVGHSNIDFLSLEGLTPAAIFINGGGLTAKEVFLKNLNTTNANTIEAVLIEAQGGTFNNTGHLEAETKIGLGTDKFINSGTVTADEVQGLSDLKEFTNTTKGKITTTTALKMSEQTNVVNDGSIESEDGAYQILGPTFRQNGKISGKSLATSKDTVVITGTSQELVLEETFLSDSTLPLALAGTVSVKEFDYTGKLDLHGTLNATFFKGHGTIQATGKLNCGHTHLIGDLTNLGTVDAQVLEADARLSTHGSMRVRHQAKVTGAFTVTPEGSFTGYQDDPLALTLQAAAAIAGHVGVDILDAKSIHITSAGQLLSKQKTSLGGSLTVEKDATADLKGLKLTRGEIANLGKLTVTSVDPTSIAIKLTNSGNAIIDDQQVLPKVDAQSPENLVRVAAMTWPMSCILSVDHEFNHDNLPDCRINGLKYFRLHKALSTKVAYGDEVDSSAAFAVGQDVRKLATRYKREFLKLYESLLTRSTTEGSAAEQVALQQYIKPFEPLYQETLTKRDVYAQSLPQVRGAALMVEDAKIPKLKLHLFNQATGQLTLKSGKFEFAGDTALVNEGTLTQESAYSLWLTGTPGVFNRGTWQSKGSLGLLGYTGQAVGKLEVAGSLHVDTTLDALEAFRGLAQAKTRKVIMHAPRVKDTTKIDKVLPWVIELRLLEDFESTANLYTGGLQLFCRNFNINGDLSADIKDGAEVLDPEQGFLRVTATHNARVGITGYLYGRKAAAIRAQYLTVEGREQIPGANLTELVFPFSQALVSRIIYRRAQNGIYSLDGPVCLDFAEEFINHFGTIKGTYFVANGKTFRNIAGFIQGTDATQPSQIVADKISNLREGLEKYQYGVLGDHPTIGYMGKVYYSEKYCEVSPQSIIEHAGDLSLIYRTLTNEVSDITSAKSLFLDARRADQTLAVGDVGSRTQLEADMARTANPPGVTVTWDRHGHTSLIRGKHSVTGTLGDAQLAGGVHARSIALTAAQMTLLNRELDQAQSASVLRLAQHIQNSQSSMYRLIGDGNTYDTRFALSQSSRMFPRSIVSITSMPGNMSINLGATWRALEFAFDQNFPYLNRGLQYLGLSFADLCEMSAEEVRGRQGAQVHRRLITDGRDEREVDVVTHHELTSPQALGKAFMPMLVMEFGRNISRVEADIDRAEQARAIEAQARSLSSRSQDLLKAAQSVEPKEQFDFSLFVPKQETVHGLKGDGGRTDVKVTDGDFTSLGAVVSGHGGSIVVPRGGAKILSQTQRVYTGDILHEEESFREVVIRAGVENYGTGIDREFRIVSATDIEIEGARFKTAEKDSVISMTTPGQIIDRALAVHSRQTSESYGKDSYTKEVVDETIMHPSEYSGAGAVDMRSGTGVAMQAPDVACTVRVEAPFLALPDAINQRSVQSTTESHSVSLFGGARKKTVATTMRSFFSRGGKLKGPEFIARVQHFSATNVEFDTRADITATERAELLAGRSGMTYHTQTVSEDMIWKKVEVSAGKHLTHQACPIRQPATFHTPDLTMERIRGSGPAAHLHSDTLPQYTDLVDQHEHHHHSQKSLTAGAAMIVKLAVAAVAMYATPLSGALGGGIPGAMVSAGVGTLCGDTAICLIENDGDIGRAMRELGKRDVVKNVARSMLAAGLVYGITDLVSSAGTVADTAGQATQTTSQTASQATQSTASTLTAEMASQTFGDYAQTAVIQSAVNTVLSVAMDGQDFGEALKHGIVTAGINTLASYGAGKIGRAYYGKAFNPVNHKALHGLLGAASGATSAAVFGRDVGQGAVAGALGAVVAVTITEMLTPTTKEALAEAQTKRISPKEFRQEFMERARRSSQWGNFAAAVSAFVVGQDVATAHATASNATAHNCNQVAMLGALAGEAVLETALIAQRYFKIIEAAFVVGGMKALLDSIKITSNQDGSFTKGEKHYETLTQALQDVSVTSIFLPEIVAAMYAIKMLEINPDAGKPQALITPRPEPIRPLVFTTPIQESGPTAFVTPMPDLERPILEGYEPISEELQELVRRGLQEGFSIYDGPDLSVLAAVRPYEVGEYKELKGRSDTGDGLDVHHAPQKHAGKQVIPGYQEHTGPSIVLPRDEHLEIPNLKGDYSGTARDLLGRDARNLREFTGAPNAAIQELIELAKQQAPVTYQKEGGK